jgi:hypothetical protein
MLSLPEAAWVWTFVGPIFGNALTDNSPTPEQKRENSERLLEALSKAFE